MREWNMKRFSVMEISCIVVMLVLIGYASCATARYPDPKEYGEYAQAIRRDDISYVKRFTAKYKKYAITDIELIGHHFNPVEIAAISDSNDIVKFLLEKGADPNALSPSYKVPIIFVMVANKKVEAIKLAIEHGSKVDIKDDGGMSLIGYAASTGSLEVVSALLPAIKDINAVDERNGNALFGAIYSDSIEILNLLAARGIDLNNQDSYGNTPLLYAIGLGQIAIAERLIELGAGTSIMNEKGYDAKRLAEHMGLAISGL